MARDATTRRTFCKTAAGASVMAAIPAPVLAGQDEQGAPARPEPAPASILRKRIPRTGELLPVIGLGTSQTFDVSSNEEIEALVPVMRIFLDAGGSLIDSSPMYGQSEAVTGELLERVGRQDVFFTTKVWTDEGRDAGIAQMNESMGLMGAGDCIDLMQIHNLVAWETHLPTLREWKEAGKLRYLGITEMRNWELVERIMREESIDFIQIPYSMGEREVEERILPAALDLGVAVLVMRPFMRSRLFERVEGRELPDFAAEIDCTSWAQFFLKWIIAHPAVTCPIPATSNPRHMLDDMRAGSGPMPDEATRARMVEYIK
jgi:diketogulonate reductase-like aldo/keto reductase